MRKSNAVKRVYVAGLYSCNADGSPADVIGVMRNMRAGQMAARQILEMGFAVFCPWLDFQFGLLDDAPLTKEVFMANSMAWLEVSDAIVVISGEGLGTGVDKEIARALELDLLVYRSLEEFMDAHDA